MKELKIRFAKTEECKSLAVLSEKFAKENCCNNILADNESYYFDKEVAVAVVDGKIVGYCYGEIKKEAQKTSYSNVVDKYYNLEEIYVLPKFRSAGFGGELFKFIESYAKALGCKTLRLNAVNKDYNKMLNFYINKLGMKFISAYLVKTL